MEDANYHYEVIPFGLKNVRAIYQRLMMDIVVGHLIGKNVEVHVKDIVVKSSALA